MKLSLYYPVTPKFISQGFGVNGAYYQAHGIDIIGHNGLDMQAKHGQPIYAAHDGDAYYEIDGNQGEGVVLRTTQMFDFPDGPAFAKTIYWHMVDSNKEPLYTSPVKGHDAVYGPLRVKAGDLLGYANSTGLSTGDHLHFGFKPCLPGEPVGTWYNVYQTNGYLGAIDPSPYFNGLFASDIGRTHKHTFYLPLKYGDVGNEVLELQRCLQSIGYFPSTTVPDGHYGPITSGAVFAFQKDHVITGMLSYIAVWSSLGRNVGTFTLPILNNYFN